MLARMATARIAGIGATLLGVSSFAMTRTGVRTTPYTITVYKSPSCSCCRTWVDQVRNAGFQVVIRDTLDMTSVRRAMGVPEPLMACHTALVDGYLIEGHVPPDLIRGLLRDRPSVRGLAVPGMPGRAMGDSSAPHFDVVSFDSLGATKVVATGR